MNYQHVLLEIDDPVATITLNRPEKLNAMTLRTTEELRHALIEADRSRAVVGIVLTGAGRGFSAGLDLGEVEEMERAGSTDVAREGCELPVSEPRHEHASADFERPCSYLMSLRKPVIAAINGPCVGLGFSFAMFSDLRFMSSAAVISTAFSGLGLVGEHGTAWLLPRLIGISKTLDVLWSGRKIGAEEALNLGLVHRVMEPDQLLEEAKGYIKQLARSASPTSLLHMKRQVYSYLMQPLRQAMAETETLQNQSMTWPDLAEGMAAFAEKRPPNFPRIGDGRWTSDPKKRMPIADSRKKKRNA
jgi:enoyl-CoA hydratase/carnithine racemase